MTDSSKMLIGLVVDRSGSMGWPADYTGPFFTGHVVSGATRAEEMGRGIATLFKKQAKENPKAMVTLAQFDTEYELVYPATPIKKVPDYTINPRGGTALHDAIGRFCVTVGEELASMDEDDRPGAVMIVIVTDGEENSSREWTRTMVKDMISKQTKKYSWDFVFLGAGLDAKEVAHGMGIARGKSMTYTSSNSASVMDSMSNYASNVAMASAGAAPAEAMASVNFTKEDEANAVKEVDSDQADKITSGSGSK